MPRCSATNASTTARCAPRVGLARAHPIERAPRALEARRVDEHVLHLAVDAHRIGATLASWCRARARCAPSRPGRASRRCSTCPCSGDRRPRTWATPLTLPPARRANSHGSPAASRRAASRSARRGPRRARARRPRRPRPATRRSARRRRAPRAARASQSSSSASGGSQAFTSSAGGSRRSRRARRSARRRCAAAARAAASRARELAAERRAHERSGVRRRRARGPTSAPRARARGRGARGVHAQRRARSAPARRPSPAVAIQRESRRSRRSAAPGQRREHAPQRGALAPAREREQRERAARAHNTPCTRAGTATTAAERGACAGEAARAAEVLGLFDQRDGSAPRRAASAPTAPRARSPRGAASRPRSSSVVDQPNARSLNDHEQRARSRAPRRGTTPRTAASSTSSDHFCASPYSRWWRRARPIARSSASRCAGSSTRRSAGCQRPGLASAQHVLERGETGQRARATTRGSVSTSRAPRAAAAGAPTNTASTCITFTGATPS